MELAARGYDPADAAELAGYERGEARALIRHPRINAALVDEARKLARGRLVPLALRALTRLLDDPTTPPVTIARVAMAILAQARALSDDGPSAQTPTGEPGDPLGDLPVRTMTRAELSAAKANINQVLAVTDQGHAVLTHTPQRLPAQTG